MKLQHEKIKTIKLVCRLSPTIIITGHEDNSICVWDLSSPEPLVTIYRNAWSAKNDVYLSPTIIKINEETFACSVSEGIRIVNIKTDNYTLLKCNGDNIVALMLSPDGDLVSGSADHKSSHKNKITVWNLQDYTIKTAFYTKGKNLGHYKDGPHRYLDHMLVLPDNRIAFSTYNEFYGSCAIVIWDTRKNDYFCLPSGQGHITGLTLEKNELIALFASGRLEKWDIEKRELISSADHDFISCGAYNWHGAKKVSSEYVAAISISDISFLSLKGRHRNTFFKTSFAYFSDPVQHDELWMKVGNNCIINVDPSQLNKGGSLYDHAMGGYPRQHADADYGMLTALIEHDYDSRALKWLRSQQQKIIKDRNGMTVLHLAAIHGNLDLAKKILAIDNQLLFEKNKEHKTPYDLAKHHQHPALIHFFEEQPGMQRILLEEALAQLNAQHKILKDQLQKAQAELHKIRRTPQESEKRKELDKPQNSPLDTLLLEASSQGELERAHHLLALNANINAKNEHGQTSLLLSMTGKYKNVVNFLMTKNPDLTVVDKKGNNLIENLAVTANAEMLILLIKQYPKENGISFLCDAYNKTKEFKTDEHVYVRKILSDSMLKYAIKQGNLAAVKRVICEFRADIDARDEIELFETPLHKAVYLSHHEIADYLLEAGAKTDIQEVRGQTAIGYASGQNKDSIIRLIKHYELLRCVQKGDKDGLEKLMAEYAGLGLNNYNNSINHNLLVAALKIPGSMDQEIRMDIIKLLLSNGANVNVLVGTTTPLHLAVSLNDREVIKLLIKAGALKDNKNFDYKTVIEFARVNNKPDLADDMIELFTKENFKKKHGIVSKSSFTQFGKSSVPKQETPAVVEEALVKNTITPK